MQFLLKRSMKFKPATDIPPEPSAELKSLWSRLETRRWIKNSLTELEFLIQNLDDQLGFIEHIKTCERCQMEMCLSVERYMGSRGPWWIDLRNGDYLPEYYPGCPKVEDYRIGSYWTGTSDDTLRFIKDRLAWAEKITAKEFSAACKLVKILENWPVTQGIPETSWVQGMVDEIAGELPIFLG